MSKLEKLMNDLSTQSLELIELGKIINYEQPSKYIVKDTKYNDDFKIPVLTAGQSFILGYTNEKEGIYKASKENPVIIFDDFTTSFHWVTFDFKVKSSAIKILKVNNRYKFDFRYIFHAMKNIKYTPETHTRQWIDKYSKFKIPIPSIEIQKEIAFVLDSYSELNNKLISDLKSELEVRYNQYKYYRKKLLNYNRKVEISTLGDISIKTYSGATPKVGNSLYYKDGNIPWLRTQEVRFNDIYDTELKITQNAILETAAKWIPKNCVIIAISGATAGRSAINKIPLTTNQHCCCLEIDNYKANYRYVFHWVSSNYEELKSLGRGARGDLNAQIIKSYKIKVPSLEDQQRIVDILDKYDVIYREITKTIQLEIEARQKQYEYYRDKLLTFKIKE